MGFVADGLFSSIPFGGQSGERGRYPNRIYKVKEMQTWPHFTRFLCQTLEHPCVSSPAGRVPCLSNVTRMTVHLNSLLGGFAGVGTQGPKELGQDGENVYAFTMGQEGEGSACRSACTNSLVGRRLSEACV